MFYPLSRRPAASTPGRTVWHRSLALIGTLLLGVTSLAQAADQSSYPRPEDVNTLDGLMHAYYDVVSGPANTPRNVARDLSLHHPQAQLMVPDVTADGKPEIRRLSVSEFHAWSKPTYDRGFYEKEIRREVRRYGQMFHVFSYYTTSRSPDGPSIGRGINSIQVQYDGKRFWILSETWDSETPGNPLPGSVETVLN